MSVEMVYVIGQAEFSLPVRDNQVFMRIGERYPHEAEIVFGVNEPHPLRLADPQAVVVREELLAAVDSLLTVFKTDPELSPQRYVFDFEIFPGVPVTGDTEVHAVKFRRTEERYQLLGGVDQCVLRKFEPGSDGFPVYSESTDVRDRSVIETESHGPIKIRSTRKQSPMIGDLKRLRKFLESQSGETVTKRLQ
jgi:hypothetical protein